MADDTNTAEREAAEQWLRDRYGAYRGHFAWRELEEAFLAGRASLAASAGIACQCCGGSGEVFEHSEDCDDDLCALNGDEHSCTGVVRQCSCKASPIAVGATQTHIAAMERAWLWMENQADAQSKGGHATFDLLMLREERDALRAAIDAAASAGSEPVACNRFAWGRLYDKASILMAVIGRDGEVSSRADEVALLMHALHDVDGGEHMPGLMPAAKLITPAPPVVETSPGSPNFEGGAAYEAYMAADTHPSPPEGMAGWKDIATAPRDGTPIWLYTASGQCEGYWNYGEWVQDAVYCTYDGAGGPAFQCNPTHWMPLPAPPLPESEAKEL